MNIVPKIKSVYWWNGKVARESEALLLAKAPAKNKKKIIEAVRKNHSYTVPCINFLPAEIGNRDYGKRLEKGSVEMLKEKPEEQHCVSTMLPVAKGVMDT